MSLIDALSDSSTPVAAIGEIVAGDTAITARILETVNSSFFGLTRVVRSPSHAVALLGLDMIKALVLSLEVVSEFEGTVMPGDMSVDALWDHGMAVGAAARRISMAEGGDKESVDLAMAAGLLHDQGKLVLAENLDEKYADILKFSSEKDISFYDAEKSSFGVTHSDICAYIMAMWGMPKRLVDAIRYHHNPDDAAEYGFNVLAAVHTADALVNFMDDDGIPGGNVKPDAEFLRKSRLEKKLPEWTDTIRQVVNDEKVLR
jgi:HD-like signal output (HDOD) protein